MECFQILLGGERMVFTMKMRIRILSLVLIVALVALAAPIATFADSNNTDYASQLDTDGHLNIALTENDVKNLLEQTTGDYAVLDYSGVTDFTGLTVQLDPSWFIKSGKGLLLTANQIGGLYISNAAWKEIGNVADEGNITLTLKKGSVVTSITQNGEAIDWYSFNNPMLLSIPYNVQGDPDYAVIYKNNGTEEPKHLIPRSWYENGMVYALVYSTGEYDVQYMGKTCFNDTDGKWMDNAANYMAARNVITGEDQGIYKPDKHITRAEFVTMLMDMFDIQLQGLWMPRPYNDQKDVPQWASKAVLQATAMGILTADKGDNFNPNADITRQDMFTITYNLMEKLGIIEQSEGGMVLREFNDSDKIADYAYMPLLTLVQNGLICGSQNAINPTQPATKAEAAQFLYNILKYDIKKANESFDTPHVVPAISQQTLQPPEKHIASANGDVTGDKIPDNIYLCGDKTIESPFIKDITLVIQDGKTGQSTDISLKNNVGYNPTLFSGDFTGDASDDILICIDSGGSGAFTYDYIYSFNNSTLNSLFTSDLYNNTYKYGVTYKDDYKVEIDSKNNDAKYIIDIGNKGDEYLNKIYDNNCKLTGNIDGFVNPISSLFPVDTDHNGVYEILAFQKIAGLYNADSIGYIENFLKWENGEFVLFNQYVGINGIT